MLRSRFGIQTKYGPSLSFCHKDKRTGMYTCVVVSRSAGSSLNFLFSWLVAVGWQPLCGRCSTLRSNTWIQQGLVSLKTRLESTLWTFSLSLSSAAKFIHQHTTSCFLIFCWACQKSPISESLELHRFEGYTIFLWAKRYLSLSRVYENILNSKIWLNNWGDWKQNVTSTQHKSKVEEWQNSL